jgi:hypothetical protein
MILNKRGRGKEINGSFRTERKERNTSVRGQRPSNIRMSESLVMPEPDFNGSPRTGSRSFNA